MTAGSMALPKSFKRALIVSVVLHVGLFVFVVASPRLSRPPKKGQIYYVNFIGGGGGGGGGTGGGSGGSTTTVVDKPQPIPAPTKRESLRDLTVAEKVQPATEAKMRYPVDKPKREKAVTEKKAAISKPEPAKAAAEADASSGQGPGYSLKFGTGEGGGGGTGGGVGGGGGGDPFGISGFPFTWYLSILSDKVTANWFKSLIDPGVSGTHQTQVYFKIYRNGQVSDLRVEASSGIQALDLSALRAIQESSPFPALPAEYDGQYLGLHLIFEHSK